MVFDPAAAGTLAHATLAAFQSRLKGHAERVTPENVEWAVEQAEACFSDALACSPIVPSGLEQRRLQADVWPAVERIVRADATFLPGFAPAHAEWSFGHDGDTPFEIAGVPVRGRADRIDTGPDGLVVIDYKLSNAYPRAKIEKNRLLQLQIYALAASDRLGLPVVGSFYRNLKTGESRGFVRSDHGAGFVSTDVVDAPALEELLARSLDLAAASIEGMTDGDITPRPDQDRCRYCLASAFCSTAVG